MLTFKVKVLYIIQKLRNNFVYMETTNHYNGKQTHRKSGSPPKNAFRYQNNHCEKKHHTNSGTNTRRTTEPITINNDNGANQHQKHAQSSTEIRGTSPGKIHIPKELHHLAFKPTSTHVSVEPQVDLLSANRSKEINNSEDVIDKNRIIKEDHQNDKQYKNKKHKKKTPVQSEGLILFFIAHKTITENNNLKVDILEESTIDEKEGVLSKFDVKFIIQQRRDTFEYFDILVGKYYNKDQLRSKFELICENERERIGDNHSIDDLWDDLFVNKNHRTYKEGFVKAKQKYEELQGHIPDLLSETKSQTKEPPWGFPKGKKNGIKETDEECALRETEEEMRIPKEKFVIIPGFTQEESYVGSDGINYYSIYFLAEVKDFVIPAHMEYKSNIRKCSYSEEIGNIFCGTFEECSQFLNPRRQIMLKNALSYICGLK